MIIITTSNADNQVSDVSALAELLHLQTLYLDGTAVTEVSLEPLARHPSLAALSVAGIPIQDPDRALHLISGGPGTTEGEFIQLLSS